MSRRVVPRAPQADGMAIAIVDTDQPVLARMALQQSIAGWPVDQVIVYSDNPEAWPGFEVQRIPQLRRIDDYNRLITRRLAEDLRCERVLVIQYDGFVLNANQWSPLFLHYDYLGAPWPQFDDCGVGNGGFSLRSRRLVDAVARLDYADLSEAEDLFICRRARPVLEAAGLRFAPKAVAAHFSVEYPGVPWPTFGFHGIFHLPQVYRHQLDFLIDNLSDRVLQTRSDFLLPAIDRLSAEAGDGYRRRLATLAAAVGAPPLEPVLQSAPVQSACHA